MRLRAFVSLYHVELIDIIHGRKPYTPDCDLTLYIKYSSLLQKLHTKLTTLVATYAITQVSQLYLGLYREADVT